MNIIDAIARVRKERENREDYIAYRQSEMAGIVRTLYEKVDALRDVYPLRYANARKWQWSWMPPFLSKTPATIPLKPLWKTTLHFYVRLGEDAVAHVAAVDCHLYVTLRRNDGRERSTTHVKTMAEAVDCLCQHFGDWELKK